MCRIMLLSSACFAGYLCLNTISYTVGGLLLGSPTHKKTLADQAPAKMHAVPHGNSTFLNL